MPKLEWERMQPTGRSKYFSAKSAHAAPNGDVLGYRVYPIAEKAYLVLGERVLLPDTPSEYPSYDDAKAACQANEDELDRRNKAPELLDCVKSMLAMMEQDHEVEIANNHYGDDSCSYCDWMDEACGLIAQTEGASGVANVSLD